MKREKICLLVDSRFYPNQEGPSIIHILLSEILAKTGFKVYVTNFVRNQKLNNFLEYQIYKISSAIQVINNDYDLVITPLWLDQTASRYALRFTKKPYVLMIHGTDLFQSVLPELNRRGLPFRLYGAFLKASTKMIVDGTSGIISTSEVFNYLKELRVDEKKFHEMNFIYKSTEIRVAESDYPWKKNGVFHILFYGRFHESKGLLYLVNAMPRIVHHSDRVILHLVGDGPLKSEAIRIVEEKKLGDHVVFHGRVSHEKVASYIMASDCVVNPITWGCGPGTVALEVLSQRKSLILGNANVTIENLYNKYGCFLLVKPYDVDDIVDKVTSLMDDRSFESTIRVRIERFINEECDEGKVGAKLEKIIDESMAYYQMNIK